MSSNNVPCSSISRLLYAYLSIIILLFSVIVKPEKFVVFFGEAFPRGKNLNCFEKSSNFIELFLLLILPGLTAGGGTVL